MRTQRTLDLIGMAHAILSQNRPMTVRQVYYQLVSHYGLENSRNRYQSVSTALVKARQEGHIPWDWIEDRTRGPQRPPMWASVSAFVEDMPLWFRRETSLSHSAYFEVWLEKDALSGIFLDVLDPFGVSLNVGRGFDGWSSIRNAARRFAGHEYACILYFGDFDPSGEEMVSALRKGLAHFEVHPEIIKCALTKADIERYSLPVSFTKKTDTRRAKFVAQHGDVAVELDALPIAILRERLQSEVEKRVDMSILRTIQRLESEDQSRLRKAVEAIA